jgi:hypothetical protein
MGMMTIAWTDKVAASEQVLVVAADADSVAPLCDELTRRGAGLAVASDVAEAALAVRTRRFDIMLVAARDDAAATALLLRSMRAEALGAPRILFIVPAADAARHGASLLLADETMASTLSAKRIADAAGVGVALALQSGSAFGYGSGRASA